MQDEDGGDGRLGEEDYDALNDETFGSAINGDWEEAHETMVRLGGNGERARKRVPDGDFAEPSDNGAFRHLNLLSSGPSSSGSTPAPFRQSRNIGDSDLELNLSSMKLDDMDLSSFTDSEAGGLSNRINLDSNVWTSHPFPNSQPLFRENLRSAFKPQQPQLPPQQHPMMKPPPEANANFPPQGLKITTLEDIERNLIIQQASKQQQQQQTERKMFDDFNLANRRQVATPTMLHQQQQQHIQQQQQLQQQQKLHQQQHQQQQQLQQQQQHQQQQMNHQQQHQQQQKGTHKFIILL